MESTFIRELCDGDTNNQEARANVTVGQVQDYSVQFALMVEADAIYGERV